MTAAEQAELQQISARISAAQARGEEVDSALVDRAGELVQDEAVEHFFDPVGLALNLAMFAGGGAILAKLTNADVRKYALWGGAIGLAWRATTHTMAYGLGSVARRVA